MTFQVFFHIYQNINKTFVQVLTNKKEKETNKHINYSFSMPQKGRKRKSVCVKLEEGCEVANPENYEQERVLPLSPPTAEMDRRSDLDTETPDEGKRKRRAKLLLNEQTQEELIGWIQSTPCLYDKGLKEYRDSEKSARIWTQKAEELNITVDQLRCWWRSLRTRFGKLSSSKWRRGSKELTDRDKYIFSRLAFLEGHITRVPHRQSHQLKCATLADGARDEEDVEDEEEQEEDGDNNDSELKQVHLNQIIPPEFYISQPPLPPPTVHVESSNQKPQLKCIGSLDSSSYNSTEEDLVSLVREGNERTQRSLKQLEDVVTMTQQNSPPSIRQAWGQWLVSAMNDIHPSLWKEFTDSSYRLMTDFLEQSRVLRATKEDQPTQYLVIERKNSS